MRICHKSSKWTSTSYNLRLKENRENMIEGIIRYKEKLNMKINRKQLEKLNIFELESQLEHYSNIFNKNYIV